jgi:hypothetical protein
MQTFPKKMNPHKRANQNIHNHCTGTTPEHVEQQMFLKENHFLWNLEFFTLKVYNQEEDDEIDPD